MNTEQTSPEKSVPATPHRQKKSKLPRLASSTLAVPSSAVVPAPEPTTTTSLSTTPAPTTLYSAALQDPNAKRSLSLTQTVKDASDPDQDPEVQEPATPSTLATTTNIDPPPTSSTNSTTTSPDSLGAAPTACLQKASSLSANARGFSSRRTLSTTTARRKTDRLRQVHPSASCLPITKNTPSLQNPQCHRQK